MTNCGKSPGGLGFDFVHLTAGGNIFSSRHGFPIYFYAVNRSGTCFDGPVSHIGIPHGYRDLKERKTGKSSFPGGKLRTSRAVG